MISYVNKKKTLNKTPFLLNKKYGKKNWFNVIPSKLGAWKQTKITLEVVPFAMGVGVTSKGT